jgi:hypothetical protein
LFDPNSTILSEKLEKLRRLRSERNASMLKRLAELGVEISEERVAELAGGRVVGRPHFARAMMEKGYVKTMQEAFDRYLADGGPGYVRKDSLTAERAIELVSKAGGVCAVAHPGEHRNVTEAEQWRVILAPFVDAGMGGLECLYPEHTPKQRKMFLEVADYFGLVPTGGSDFHGANRPGVRLGKGRGNLEVPYEALEKLRERQAAA